MAKGIQLWKLPLAHGFGTTSGRPADLSEMRELLDSGELFLDYRMRAHDGGPNLFVELCSEDFELREPSTPKSPNAFSYQNRVD